jgi:hypothetical protein
MNSNGRPNTGWPFVFRKGTKRQSDKVTFALCKTIKKQQPLLS